MKKVLFFLLIIIFAPSFAQEIPKKLSFFTTLDVNVGLDLADIIRRDRAQSDYEERQLPPGKFNYGASAIIGYQPLKWFALAGGIRYSFIDPNYHILYYKVQPQFIISDPLDEDFG